MGRVGRVGQGQIQIAIARRPDGGVVGVQALNRRHEGERPLNQERVLRLVSVPQFTNGEYPEAWWVNDQRGYERRTLTHGNDEDPQIWDRQEMLMA